MSQEQQPTQQTPPEGTSNAATPEAVLRLPLPSGDVVVVTAQKPKDPLDSVRGEFAVIDGAILRGFIAMEFEKTEEHTAAFNANLENLRQSLANQRPDKKLPEEEWQAIRTRVLEKNDLIDGPKDLRGQATYQVNDCNIDDPEALQRIDIKSNPPKCPAPPR